MSAFTGKIKYTRERDGFAKCVESVKFYLSDDREGEFVEIPEGAVSNFATIPKSFQFIFRPDIEDVKMPSFFHDLLVCEWGQQAYIQIEKGGVDFIVRKPDWSESAYWFRIMIHVRQRETRKKKGPIKKIVLLGADFCFKWACWGAVIMYGYARKRLSID